jgi:hypothetical protein
VQQVLGRAGAVPDAGHAGNGSTGGRPAVLSGTGDSTATVCLFMDMDMEVISPRRCTSILCTNIAERDANYRSSTSKTAQRIT